jgi:hypothetical protein
VWHEINIPQWKHFFEACLALMNPVLMGRIGSPAAACSSLADSATGGSWAMVDRS